MRSSIPHGPRNPARSPRVGLRVLLLLALVAPGAVHAQSGAAREALEWAAAGATFGGAVAVDQRLREALFVRADSSLPPLARIADQAGRRRYSYPALGALYLGGRATGNDRLSRGALHTAEALMVTGIASGALKQLVGRGRPDNSEADGDDFRPLDGDDRWASFPSRHTVTAFTLATAIAEEVDSPWASVLSYGAASVVGWSRIRSDRHWASDVVAGAILGTALTQATLRFAHRNHNEGDDPTRSASPVIVRITLPIP